MNTKRSPTIYLYPDITHLRHKEGTGPLCNAQGGRSQEHRGGGRNVSLV